jgi:hypothetical protein
MEFKWFLIFSCGFLKHACCATIHISGSGLPMDQVMMDATQVAAEMTGQGMGYDF